MFSTVTFAVVLAGAAVPALYAQHAHQHHAEMDRRGDQAMGFDQAKIVHTFTKNERGGTIQIRAKDVNDQETVRRIRVHLREIAKLFKAGDFSKPLFIHAEPPPGSETMAARRDALDYRFEEIPSGGRLVVTSAEPEAIAAVHAFMGYQQHEHTR